MSTTRHHAEWLSLLEISGPFLSMPVLMKNFPQGLDTVDVEIKRKLRMACEEWLANRDSRKPDPSLHQAWIKFVLTEALEMPQEVLAEGPGIPPGLQVKIPQYGETLRPDLVIINPDDGKARILIEILPAGTFLEKPLPDHRWKASPAGRMLELLHGTGVILGVITNGEQWMLVHAPPDETTSYISWYASLWQEEPLTLQSFCSLLKARRLFGVTSEKNLEGMFSESMQNQHEVTDQLGYQVRRAVEVLVRTFDRIDQDTNRELLKNIPEKTLYDSALSIMMRLVFLFCAEERKMLPLDDPFYNENYAVSTISAHLRETADQQGEEVLERRYDGWCRLLATFRAVHGGISHERLHLPAYGGQLFDPDRYPFLEGRQAGTVWQETPANPLPVDNRTVLHLLEALQYLQMKLPGGGPAEPRRLSFRALDIEQIGHVYEGLLDHTVFKADDPVLGIVGTKYNEPEIPVPVLEEYKKKGDKELIKFLAGETGKSEKSLFNIFKAEITREQYKKLSTFCGNDEDLFDRIFPFEGLIRDDTFGYPIIIPSGSFYVTQGSDRRTTGTHYTPRSLTEPIVKYTLEPIIYDGPSEGKPEEEWQLKSPGEILELKICDMAMGSGAFLVQACRYMSELLIEAWEKVEKKYHEASGITVEGEPVNGKIDVIRVPSDPDDRFALARRLIVDRCLYGVDKNPMAVEMAKLSLWLVTMQKNIPFTFLDHALKCGDSLLGITDLNQIKYFHLDPEKGKEFHRYFDNYFDYAELCASTLKKSVGKRNMLEKFIVKDTVDFDRKKKLNEEANLALERVKFISDLIVGTAISTAGNKKKDAFEEGLYNCGTKLRETFISGDFIDEENLRKEVFRLINYGKPEKQESRKPFHWALEFPEVFENRAGFNAIIGNPPFQGGQKITGALGIDYRDYIVKHLANEKRGSADLCAYFFLRLKNILRYKGTAGLLATDTIAEGEAQEIALEQMIRDSFSINRAIPSQKWPGTATVKIASIWFCNGMWNGYYILNGIKVEGISTFLSISSKIKGKPYKLYENSGKSFQGSTPLGTGFILTSEEANEIINKNPMNKKVVVPYLNGEDLNTRVDQSPGRWIINFYDWPLEKANLFPECLNIVQEKVKPEREKQKDKKAKEFWWRYTRPRLDLYKTIKNMKRVIGFCKNATKYVALAWVQVNQAYSVNLGIIATELDRDFAVYQSSIHEIWVTKYGSTLGGGISYTSENCIDTFPLPRIFSNLDSIAKSYDNKRRELMLFYNEGLTKLYNHFHEPKENFDDIQKLRDLHLEMDYAVAKVYGWDDLDLGHGFYETKQGLRYTIFEEARREVLDRLLLLNYERYEEHIQQSLHEKEKSKNKSAKKEKKKPDENIDDLFGFG